MTQKYFNLKSTKPKITKTKRNIFIAETSLVLFDIVDLKIH